MITCEIKKGLWVIAIVLLLLTPAFAGTKSMVYATSAEVTTWDPSASYSTEITYMVNFYETLIRVNPPGSAEPYTYLLATGFSSSEDGLEYTFKLRQGVKFHDGTAFTANAVKLSIERTRRLKQGAAFIWDDLEKTEIIDDYTITFFLKKPVPLPQILASSYASYIMSPSVIDKPSDWFDEGNECGTGPYTLKNYKDGESWIMSKFPEYWGGWKEGQAENVLVKISQDALVKMQMLMSGEAQIVNNIPTDSYANIRDTKDTTVLYGPSFYNFVAFFNTSRPPLDNVKRRRALCYAMPYQDIIKVALLERATQARCVIPAGQFGHTKDVFQYSHDLKKARQLLAEAGLPKGGLKLKLIYTAGNQNEVRMAPLIKDALAKIGVDLDIQALVWNTQWEIGKRAEKDGYDIFLVWWWPTFADPYETLVSLFGTEQKTAWNFSYYSNPTYDKLIRKAYESAGSHPENALKLYVNAQNILQQDAPAAFLGDQMTSIPVRRELQNVVINPAYPGGLFFYDMRLK